MTEIMIQMIKIRGGGLEEAACVLPPPDVFNDDQNNDQNNNQNIYENNDQNKK